MRNYDIGVRNAEQNNDKAWRDMLLEFKQRDVKIRSDYVRLCDKAKEEISRLRSEREKISKKTVELVNQLADCKSKATAGGIDPRLIGTWECTGFKKDGKALPEGGTGFQVTFNKDGTEEVDYSKMVPFTDKGDPGESISYSGKGSSRISAKDGVAKLESLENEGVMMTLESKSRKAPVTVKVAGLGPGGLGSADKNNYTCSEDSLEYQTSMRPDRHASCTVKLTRVKPKE
jgi:hypothetical protein